MNEILFGVAMALIFVALCGICFAISQVTETLEKVLQRWAALDSLGLTPDTRKEILEQEIRDLEDELDPALRSLVRDKGFLKEVGFAPPGEEWVLDENQQWRLTSELKPGDDRHG